MMVTKISILSNFKVSTGLPIIIWDEIIMWIITWHSFGEDVGDRGVSDGEECNAIIAETKVLLGP